MNEHFSRRNFIRLGTVLGVSAATASLVTCGGGSGGGGSGNGGSGGGGYGSGGSGDSNAAGKQQSSEEKAAAGNGKKKDQDSAPGGEAIARASEVSPGSALEFTDSGQPAVLVHLKSGDFAAYSAVCTHQRCTVAYQKSSGQLACPCHGSVFDPSKGAQVVTGPATRPLPEIQVEVRGGEVYKA